MKAARDGKMWLRSAVPLLGTALLGVALVLALLCLLGTGSRAAPLPVERGDRAGDRSGSWSSVTLAPINAVPDVPELIRPADGAWINQSEVEFEWSSVGNVEYDLRVGSLETTTAATSTVLALDDGTYTWTVRARKGQASEWAPERTVNVDTAQPLVEIAAPAKGAVLTTTHPFTVTISGTASDAGEGSGLDRVEVHTGAAWERASGTDSWTYAWALPYADNLAETLQARSFDGAGNESAAYTVSVTVDTVAPACSAPVPDRRPYVTSTVVYAWPPASDGSGVLRYQVHITSTGGYSAVFNAAGPEYVFTQATQEQKRYYARVQALDGLGNWGDPSRPSSMVIPDLTPPSIDMPSIAEGGEDLHAVSTTLYYNDAIFVPETFEVRGYSEDALSGVDRVCFSPAFGEQPACDTAGFQPWQSGNPGYAVDPGTEESGAIVATVYDDAGNTVQQAFPYELDDTPPQSSASTLPDYVSDDEFPVPWSASDAQSGVHSVNLWFKYGMSGSWTYWDTLPAGEGSFQFRPPVHLEGTYCFATVARDNLDNRELGTEEADSCTVYDKGKPSSEVTWAPEHWNRGDAPITMTWAATPSLAPLLEVRLWVRKNEGEWTETGISHTQVPTDPIPLSGTFSFDPPGDGRYDLATVAWDEKDFSEPPPYVEGDQTTRYDTAIGSPIGLKCIPSGWSRDNSFAVRWENPEHRSDPDYPSGIAAAYWRLGEPPRHPGDGEREEGDDLKEIGGITLPGQGQHTVWVWLEDNALNVTHARAVSTSCKYDASVGAPANLASIPPGWTASGDFAVTWANPPDLSGIDGAYYSLDSAPTGPEDGIWEPGPALDRIEGITVTEEGTHTLYLWLHDAAGNNGFDWGNWRTVHLLYDPTPPTDVSIAAPVTATRVSFVVSWSADAAASGVQSYTVEYRELTDIEWRTWLTSTRATSGRFTAPRAGIEYVLRVTAYDKVGRSAQAQTRVYVERQTLLLPLLREQWPDWYRYDVHEPNDTWSDAYGPLVPDHTYRSYLWNQKDLWDYYYLIAGRNETFRIVLDDIPGDCDYDLYLYDEPDPHASVASSAHEGSGRETLVYKNGNEERKYWIWVPSLKGYSSTQPYSLRFTYE